MMDYRKIKQQLEESFLSCQICEEPVRANQRELKLLPCQHSLCGKCLTEMIKKKRKVTCPFCREEYPLPESGNFPSFRYAQKLSEFVSSIPSGYTQKMPQVMKVSPTTSPNSKNTNKPSLIRKFRFVLPLQINVCWGKSGKLYTTNYGDNPLKPQGLYCIDVLSGKVKRFGELESTYEQLLFAAERLFAFNSKSAFIEVYRDERFLGTITKCRQLLRMSRDPLGGILLLYQTANYMLCLSHRKSTGQLVLFKSDHKRATCESSMEMVIENEVVSVYRGSIWLANKMDAYIYEIPVKQCFDGIAYKKPVRHCRLPSTSIIIEQCGPSGILYKESASSDIKMLDLTILAPQCHADNKEKMRLKESPTASANVYSYSTNLMTGVESNNVIVVASEGGFYATLADDDILNVYSTDITLLESLEDNSIDLRQLTVSNNPLLFRQFKKSLTGILQYLLRFLLIIILAGAIVPSLMSENDVKAWQEKAWRAVCEGHDYNWLDFSGVRFVVCGGLDLYLK